jgi:glycosyltransferase involved in cell wall biosynthesis
MTDIDKSGAARRDLVSIITPVYNEEGNLQVLYERLKAVMETVDADWEWLIVDDRSNDRTFEITRSMVEADPRIRSFRLARNSGSHVALTCGLDECNGDAVVLMAADLQDSPELIPELLDVWRGGGQIVSAVRRQRLGESKVSLWFSNFFYFLSRKIFGLDWMPETGADFMLLDRRAVMAIRQHEERNVHVFALLNWIGFDQRTVFYDKEARHSGATGWTLSKKIKLAIDTIVTFSYRPIRIMSLLGVMFAFFGFSYALFIVVRFSFGAPIDGWASLMVVTLIIGGMIMLMLGVLGEYIWRSYEETRHRPRYIIDTRSSENKEKN